MSPPGGDRDAAAVERFGGSFGAGSMGVSRYGRTTLLVLKGPLDDVDAAAVTSLAETALAVIEPGVIVEASGSPSGRRVPRCLGRARRRLRKRQGGRRIAGAPPATCRLCRLADLEIASSRPARRSRRSRHHAAEDGTIKHREYVAVVASIGDSPRPARTQDSPSPAQVLALRRQ